jgi:hypothetical protein
MEREKPPRLWETGLRYLLLAVRGGAHPSRPRQQASPKKRGLISKLAGGNQAPQVCLGNAG